MNTTQQKDNTMTEKITATQWHTLYVAPLINIHHHLMEPSDELTSGFAGFVLDGVLAVKNIDGEEANDWECVELVEELIRYARLVENRVEAAVQ